MVLFFPSLLFFESRKIGNVAYFVPLEHEISVNAERFKLFPQRRMRKEERLKFLEKNWPPIAHLTKPEAKERMGAFRIIHSGRWEDWTKRMQEETNKRIESKN